MVYWSALMGSFQKLGNGAPPSFIITFRNFARPQVRGSPYFQTNLDGNQTRKNGGL